MANRYRSQNSRRAKTRRTSVSLSESLYRELELMAKQKKVSLAWVIRDAAEAYVEAKWPLLARKE